VTATLNLIPLQNKYVQSFPRKVSLKAAQGFAATATVSLIAGSCLNVALIGGAIAATVAIIESVTRPIIRDAFLEQPLIGAFIQTVIVPITTISLVANSITAPVDGSLKITSSLPSLLAFLFLNRRFYGTNVGMAAVFCVVE
jgi:hypothetical protein